ncbi:MAG: WYL domain-containing protein [Candidatus Melainabacteria bacterium]|nr:WYL domain-containing protein [Candidatus Melainabacteria bacterium]
MTPMSDIDVLSQEGTGADKSNYSTSAYRVLYILLLLVQNRSLGLLELNLLLFDNPFIRRTYNSETITKYINTLRRVGCDIPPASRKNQFNYTLNQNPLPLDLDESLLVVARKLYSCLLAQPDDELLCQCHQLLEKVDWALSDGQKHQFQFSSLQLPATLQNSELMYQDLNRFRKLCRDALIVVLECRAEEAASSQRVTVEPHRIVQEGVHNYLIGMNCDTHQLVKINLQLIARVSQLPTKVQARGRTVNVLFQLSGRLAKSYRPYPNEELLVSSEQPVLMVRAKTDDCEALVSRLAKYGAYCEVLSPSYVRDLMRERIQLLLSRLMGDGEPDPERFVSRAAALAESELVME